MRRLQLHDGSRRAVHHRCIHHNLALVRLATQNIHGRLYDCIAARGIDEGGAQLTLQHAFQPIVLAGERVGAEEADAMLSPAP